MSDVIVCGGDDVAWCYCKTCGDKWRSPYSSHVFEMCGPCEDKAKRQALTSETEATDE